MKIEVRAFYEFDGILFGVVGEAFEITIEDETDGTNHKRNHLRKSHVA